MSDLPGYADILEARERIAGAAVRTPLIRSPQLSEMTGGTVYLKPECLQRTGSFKFRGARNAVQALGDDARAGVVACSSGNHAQGVAEAARLAGISSVIVMPSDAPVLKRERTAAFGARVVLYDRETEDREAIAADIIAEEGGHFIHPYNNRHVIAGQGTIGLEVADDLEAAGVVPDVVMAPASGGGLAAGVTLALRERFPEIASYVVEPEGFDDYGRSLRAGEAVRNERLSGSICDALLASKPGVLTFALNRDRMAGGLAVSDAEALHAVGFASETMRLVLEPGGAVCLAAVLAGRLDLREKTAVIVLSGGNIDDEMLMDAVKAYRRSA
ncbi:L-threonine ammonia-lyase [Faunimonas pinastri]|uniref:L-threonine ammonia-lyase n=1 Tax=Faunimonas pinastri TaxID=1855383 RepID=A0A1H9FCB6_9HYPH|nr:threonine/serine dehydratase [Faunimonas pinastri]SEQ35574.1 L-threonine ammonia-lyase [Faunimonas pinastri]